MPMIPPYQSNQGGAMGMSPATPGSSPQPQPSFGGQSAMQYQPTGQDMSDPKILLTTIFSKMLDLIQQVNLQYPGGEDKISEGMQQVGVGFNEKISRMGTPEPPGPPTAS